MPPSKGRGKRSNSLGKKRKPQKHVEDEEDEEEEEDDVSTKATKKGKRKRRRKYREDSPELADGDLQLLEDQGIHVKRKKKKLRKLRKKYASDDEKDDLLDELRDLEDDNPVSSADIVDKPRKNVAIDYDDDMDDFIVDGGRSKRRRRAQRKGQVSTDAVRASRSLFGDADDMLNYKPSSEPLRDLLSRRRG